MRLSPIASAITKLKSSFSRFVFANFQMVMVQVLILFALIGVGVLSKLLKLLNERSMRGMVNLLIYLVTPALIIEVFQRPFDRSMLSQFALAFAITALWHLILIAVGRAFAAGDDGICPVLRFSAVFSNAGFMGIPLEYAILGSKGVFFGIVYVAMFNLFCWSWGIRQMEGTAGGTHRWKAWVNPGTVGIAIGLPFFLCSVSLPSVLRTPIKMLSDLNTPLAMIVIGYYFAESHLRRVLGMPRAYLAAALRLVLTPLLLLAAFLPLRSVCDRTMMLALLIAASAPTAAMAAMFAAKYARDVDLAVGLVGGTTLLSIFTMPLVLSLAMYFL